MNFHQILKALEVCLLIVIFGLDLVYKCHGAGEQEKSPTSPKSSTFYLNMKSIIGLNEKELVELANRYVKKGKYDKAIQVVTEAINKNDTKASFYVLRGNCYVAKRDSKTGSVDFEKAVKLAIESGKAETLDVDDAGLLQIGKILYSNAEYEKAIWCFTEIINKNESESEYYELRRQAYDKMGEHEKSISDLKRLIELETDGKQYYRLLLIDKFFQLRRYEEALDETFLLKNIDMSYFVSICRRLGHAEQHELCKSCYTELINRVPNEAVYYEKRGDAYLKLCDLDSAMDDFKKWVKLEPENWQSWNKLLDLLDDAAKSYEVIREDISALDDIIIAKVARAFFQRDKWKRSVLFYSEAIRRDPSSALHFEKRGKCYLNMGDTDAAIFDFKNVVQKDPDNESVRVQLLELLFKAERYREVVDAVVVMNDEVRIVSVCSMVFSRNQWEDAIRCFTELMKKYPNSADISYEKRALCYVNLKKPEEVISNLENLKAIRPVTDHLQLHLCEALIDVQRYDEAAEVLRYIDGSYMAQYSDASLERISQARGIIAAAEASGAVANPVAVNA